MDLRDYRHRIAIEQSTVVKGQSRGSTMQWTLFAQEIPARRLNPSGNERRITTHGGMAPDARVEFGIRYRLGVVAGMRVVHRGQMFSIKHVNNVREEDRELILTCELGEDYG